jgi:glycosyltransferase involved in cell wall biosynthesis
MRILQVVPVFSESFGGPVSVVRSISKELAKKHEVVVYTTNALDSKHDGKFTDQEIDGYRVIQFERNFKFLCHSGMFGQLNISLDMACNVKQNISNFDIIHVHSWQQFPEIMINYYSNKYQIPYVLQVHGSLPLIGSRFKKNVYYALFGKSVLKNASKVIALTNLEARRYETMHVEKNKIKIVHNATKIEKPLLKNGFFKIRNNISYNEKIILYIGRLHKIKGIDVLIKAYMLLPPTIKKNTTLVIVGPDDGYFNELRNIVASLGASNKILFTGPLYGIYKEEVYLDANICIIPSRYEASSVSLIEAYAHGIPLIASNVEGNVELVIDKKTGLLFESENVNQLSAVILQLLNDPQLAENLGKNGQIFFINNFSIEKIIDDLEKLYLEIINDAIR